jgi:neutral ceramidase
VGSGVYDITGPAAQVLMGGYVNLTQRTAGIHQRLRSRAFIVASPCDGKRVVFVSADQGMLFQAIKQAVVRKLRAELGEDYSDENVLLSATHTHAGPTGTSHYELYNLTFVPLPLVDQSRSTLAGFVPENFDVVVNGITESIARAHRNLAPGRILLGTGELPGVGFNRSPLAYALNPQADREGRSSVDERMTLLRLEEKDGEAWRPVGVINWFAVHPTSMSRDNLLISGDNKGYASYLFEQELGTDYRAPKTFVAAFAQSNEGDVTPNTFDANGRRTLEDFAATEQSGRKQYEFARKLFEDATEASALPGVVDYRHTYVRMDDVTVDPEWADGQERNTCPAALGLSMGAGAEDGRSDLLQEGLDCGDPDSAEAAILCGVGGCRPPCHEEKPVALRMGDRNPPWSPDVLPLQILRIGNLALVGVPFEMTTVAGRRLRKTVLERLAPAGVEEVVIAGLANAYSGYLATREEYARQDYEGASTHFGPWTLAALQQEAAKVADALRTGEPVPSGPEPRELNPNPRKARLPDRPDAVPQGETFGSVRRDAEAAYRRGKRVSVRFWGANPRNDPRIQGSFLEVQRREADGSWTPVAHDWDWETVFRWERHPLPPCPQGLACSLITVEWTIPGSSTPGTYRIRHAGKWRDTGGQLQDYEGQSREFTVEDS